MHYNVLWYQQYPPTQWYTWQIELDLHRNKKKKKKIRLCFQPAIFCWAISIFASSYLFLKHTSYPQFTLGVMTVMLHKMILITLIKKIKCSNDWSWPYKAGCSHLCHTINHDKCFANFMPLWLWMNEKVTENHMKLLSLMVTMAIQTLQKEQFMNIRWQTYLSGSFLLFFSWSSPLIIDWIRWHPYDNKF